MNGPKRLADGPGRGLEVLLFRQARDELPPKGDVDRILVALGVGASAATGSASGAAASMATASSIAATSGSTIGAVSLVASSASSGVAGGAVVAATLETAGAAAIGSTGLLLAKWLAIGSACGLLGVAAVRAVALPEPRVQSPSISERTNTNTHERRRLVGRPSPRPDARGPGAAETFEPTVDGTREPPTPGTPQPRADRSPPEPPGPASSGDFGAKAAAPALCGEEVPKDDPGHPPIPGPRGSEQRSIVHGSSDSVDLRDVANGLPDIVRAELPTTEPAARTVVALRASPTPLGPEIDLLDGARKALRLGQAQEVFRLLDRYEMLFPGGTLLPEARLVRIRALLFAGERSRAIELGAQFLASNPASPHASYVRGLLSIGAVVSPSSAVEKQDPKR